MLSKFIKDTTTEIINIIYPEICIVCGLPGNKLCSKCLSKIQKKKNHQCHVCKCEMRNGLIHDSCRQLTTLDGIFIAVDYSETIRKIIEDLKYDYHFSTARLVAKIISDSLNIRKLLSDSIVIPVSLHNKKEKFRGFNQAELIARSMIEQNEIKNVKLINNLLIRNRNTKTQVGMNRGERIKNLSNAFSLNTKQINGIELVRNTEKVILLDDIYTTGTTMEECAKIMRLYLNQIGNIYGLALARG